ncbi:MAG: hypothetical protein BMS9Abin25_0295 [Gammaproteobacteria bacterium]|nr:MAG: hypothetical protein BMS9Abin25_0295 [Gammaproteobacteria bacterium]
MSCAEAQGRQKMKDKGLKKKQKSLSSFVFRPESLAFLRKKIIHKTHWFANALIQTIHIV